MLNEQAKIIKNAYLRYIREQKQDGINKREAEKQSKNIVDDIIIWSDEADKMFRELLNIYLDAADVSNTLANNLFLAKDKKVLFSIIREEVFNWINTEGAKKIVQVTDTTKEITRNVISKGMQEGLSTNKIADNISAKILDLNKSRARTIAQTEIHNTFMYSREQNFVEAGFKRWRWITAADEKVRLSHMEVNNQVREIGKQFSNGLIRPGDPTAPVGEIVNCRCDVIPEP